MGARSPSAAPDAQAYTSTMRKLAVLTMLFTTSSTAFAAIQAADTRSSVVSAGRNLVASAPDSGISRARAQGWMDHLAGISLDDLPDSLAMQADAQRRLAYLEGWSSGATGLRRSEAIDREIESLLATRFEEDPCSQIHVWEQGVADPSKPWVPPASTSDLVRRPFWNSPRIPADRIAAEGSAENIREMLEAATDAERPAVLAAILANDAEKRHPELGAVLDVAIPDDDLLRGSVVFELARRRATTALADFLRTHPTTIAVPGIYSPAISALALDDPATALELGRGREIMSRIPSRGSVSVLGSLADGLAASDPAAAFAEIENAGQLDTRLHWILAIADDVSPEDLDPLEERGPLTDVTSFRTLRADLLPPSLARGIVDRDAAAALFAHLARNGRWELVDSFLMPNTTDADRPTDSWLPYRLDILSRAFVIADFPPENWIQLFEQLPRLRSIDGQAAGLHAVADGYLRLHGERPMPPQVKRALDQAMIDIALNG